MSERKWTPAQENCIHKHGGTLLVSAAAGSGKTSVLVERIIDRITHPEHPTDIDRLLVVTFTRAAATEMKNRLAKKLSERLQAEPHNANLLRQQLLLPRTSISTIDSFCGELVRQNFHLLDIPQQFRQADDNQLSLIKKEALAETVERCYASGDAGFRELAAIVYNGKSDYQLQEIIAQLDKFLESQADPKRWLEEKSAVYDNVTSVRNTVWGQLCLNHASEQLKNAKKLCTTAIELAAQDAVLNDKYMPMLIDDKYCVDAALEACEMGTWDEAYATLNAYAPIGFKAAGKADPVLKEQVAALRGTVKNTLIKLKKALYASEETCLRDIAATRRTMQALYDAVRLFREIYIEKKLAAKMLSFSDVSERALRLLVDGFDENGKPIPSDIARELSEQYDEILVDEYQDTSEKQDALFSALSRDESNLFFVGDVKQSIYAFRQALPKNFLRRRDAYPLLQNDNYPATILLANNFRSRRQVTDTVNYAFYQLMSRTVGGLTYDDDEKLEFTAPMYKNDTAEGYETETLISEMVDEDGVKLSDNEADARTIAARIEELVGTLPIKDGEVTRPLEYRDCCILLRSRTSEYREALEARGIPVITDDATPFFETAEIRLALSLLRCIDNPLLDVSLTAWLLSPLCGFTPDDLSRIVKRGKHSSLYTALLAARHGKNAALAERCRAAVAFLERYRTLACQLTVDRLLLRIFEETALPELMSARSDGERRRLNLQVLLENCTQFEQNGFRGLTAFIRYIDRLQQKHVDLPGAPKSAEGNAVRVMTIHGSKGLEFPVVFVARLHEEFSTKDIRNNLLLHSKYGAGIRRRDPVGNGKFATFPFRALALENQNNQREEGMRLLYVAMTRAREKLFLTMAFSNPEKKLSACANWLGEKMEIDPTQVLGASCMGEWVLAAWLRHPDAAAWRNDIGRDDLPLQHINNVRMTMCTCTPPAASPAAEHTTEEAVADDAAVQEILARIAYRYPHEALAKVPSKLAASGLAHGSVERQFVAEAQPSFRQKTGMTAAERGTAMHTFMQHAVYTAAADDLQAEIARLTKAGFLTTQQADVLSTEKLAAFFQSELYARMARSPRCLREYPFTSLLCASHIDPTLSDEETLVVQGIADCVFEENGGLVIVDYKTDRVAEAQVLVEKYRSQLQTYRRALETALEMPVRECVLYSFALDTAVNVPMEDAI